MAVACVFGIGFGSTVLSPTISVCLIRVIAIAIAIVSAGFAGFASFTILAGFAGSTNVSVAGKAGIGTDSTMLMIVVVIINDGTRHGTRD